MVIKINENHSYNLVADERFWIVTCMFTRTVFEGHHQPETLIRERQARFGQRQRTLNAPVSISRLETRLEKM